MSAANKKGGRAMAKQKEPTWMYVGQDDLDGATVTEVGWNELKLEKDGRTFKVELEEEWPDTCMCYDGCQCQPSSYLRVQELK